MQNNINLQENAKKALNNKTAQSWKSIHIEKQHQDVQNVHFEQNEQMYKEVLEAVESLSELPRLLVDKLIFMQARYGTVYASQETIAKWLGCTPRTVRRIITYLKTLGLINWQVRGVGKTNLYFVNPLLNKMWFRRKLSTILLSCYYAVYLFQLVQARETQNIHNSSSLSEYVRQEKNIVIFKYYSALRTMSVSKPYIVEESNSGPDPGHSIKKTRQIEKAAQSADRRIVSMNETNPIREDIRALKELRLTKWGQIKLMAFDSAVIRYASERLRTKKGNVNDPFAWFVTICIRRSQELGLHPDWQKMRFLQMTYKQPSDACMTLPYVPQPTPKPVTPPMRKDYDEFRTNFDYEGEAKKFETVSEHIRKNLAIIGMHTTENFNPFKDHDTLQENIKLLSDDRVD